MSTVLSAMSIGLILVGLLVITLSVWGMIRLRSIYLRLHSAGKGVTLGILGIALGSVGTMDPWIIGRALLIAVFLLLTAPVSAHAIGRAAQLRGDPMERGALDESKKRGPP